MNYKHTLNLPVTDFPMRGNLAENEPARLNAWKLDKLYEQMLASKSKDNMFILHDGPPYANGNIHLGHALNKIIKDIIVKSKTLSGYHTPFIPGWDCHGLPIELKVEKALGYSADKQNPYPFQQACRQYAKEQVQIQKQDFERLGLMGDWDQPYLTMDPQIEAENVLILAQLLDKGYIVRGNKPVNWCTNCGSSLAEAEVEYEDITSTSVYVTFKVVNQESVYKKLHLPEDSGDLSILIWTTTIWTLPANKAVAVHPDIEYAIVEYGPNAEKLIVASKLLETLMHKKQIEHYEVLGICKGNILEYEMVQHPFYNVEVPIILGEHVTDESGTGAVHTAPAHGQDDYIVGQAYNLEVVSLLSSDCTFITGTQYIEHQSIAEANRTLLHILKDNHHLFLSEQYVHSYPHCWRHKTPIIFKATPQWFIDLSRHELRQTILQQIEQVHWTPHRGENSMRIMTENRPDWCISRQRSWGIPMCLFIHKQTQALHPNTQTIMQQIAERIRTSGIEVWWTLDAKEFLGPDADDYEKVSDVLDVWFESGCTNLSVVKKRPEFHHHLSDLYLEGIDQYRGWLMSSLVLATAITKQAPYKNVITHGFTVDSTGHKMSKSLGNGIEPADIVNEYGADILRLWVASTEYTKEMTLSKQILQSISDIYRRIRNTGRYFLASLHDFDPNKDMVASEQMLALDRWAIDTAYHMQEKIIKDYDHYQFHKVLKHLMHFCSIQMGAFYFEITKDRQYTLSQNSLARRSCQTALYHMLQAFIPWIAPILSFTADELWTYLPGQHSKYVFTETWYKGLLVSEDSTFTKEFWQFLLQIRNDINKAIENGRAQKLFSQSLEVEIEIYITPQKANYLELLEDELRFVFLSSKVYLYKTTQFPEHALQDEQGTYAILVKKTDKAKCERCWHHVEDVGTHTDHPHICGRCVNNLYDQGEIRRFV
ncbi:MAG TPA: isoleucine--tRNA ligase [Legionellaceae bacterium]|nr:isoleucine--tRNA ligase [Legionellaceae bacterium]